MTGEDVGLSFPPQITILISHPVGITVIIQYEQFTWLSALNVTRFTVHPEQNANNELKHQNIVSTVRPRDIKPQPRRWRVKLWPGLMHSQRGFFSFFLSLTCHHPIKSNLLQKKKFSITIIISCLCPKTESDAGWVWSHILHEEIADEGNVSKAISFVSQWSESALQSSVNELPPANIGDITRLTWWETSRPQPSFLLSSLRPRRRENPFWHRSIIWSVRRNLGENDKKKKKKKKTLPPHLHSHYPYFQRLYNKDDDGNSENIIGFFYSSLLSAVIQAIISRYLAWSYFWSSSKLGDRTKLG